MADIKKSAAQLIGRTPLLEASNYAESQGITDVVLLAKLEYLNPAGSVSGGNLETGRNHYRTDFRQYGYRSGLSGCGQGIQGGIYSP